jgi:hypothetical protein
MKIPAVALVAAFGGGIVLRLQLQIGSSINTQFFLTPASLGIAAVMCLARVQQSRGDWVLATIPPLRAG